MDRQRIDGGVKKTTGNIRSGEAMDAVREVVNQEGEGNAESSAQTQSCRYKRR